MLCGDIPHNEKGLLNVHTLHGRLTKYYSIINPGDENDISHFPRRALICPTAAGRCLLNDSENNLSGYLEALTFNDHVRLCTSGVCDFQI